MADKDNAMDNTADNTMDNATEELEVPSRIVAMSFCEPRS